MQGGEFARQVDLHRGMMCELEPILASVRYPSCLSRVSQPPDSSILFPPPLSPSFLPYPPHSLLPCCLPSPPLPLSPSPQPLQTGYRNKVELTVGTQPDNTPGGSLIAYGIGGQRMADGVQPSFQETEQHLLLSVTGGKSGV